MSVASIVSLSNAAQDMKSHVESLVVRKKVDMLVLTVKGSSHASPKGN